MEWQNWSTSTPGELFKKAPWPPEFSPQPPALSAQGQMNDLRNDRVSQQRPADLLPDALTFHLTQWTQKIPLYTNIKGVEK
ncbi:hypothetical protein TNCT_83121 [Trichonephila clavata]|uniref:Uncharacterized protein n=1 Tax=Trichonephila clavata TaxID=2740835 RepID=A0A8X6M5K1_TRICU|nr:hypothetical protein TNCT_83121 [Trichonephila clavata]